MAAPQPINERFNDSYSEAGLQPATGQVRKIRFGEDKAANDPTIRRTKVEYNPDFQAAAANDATYNKKITKKVQKNVSDQGAPKKILPAFTKKQRLKREAAKGGAAGKAAEMKLTMKARARATRVNIPIFTWGAYAWLFFQLPVAVLSFLALIATIAFYDLIDTITGVTENDGVVLATAKELAGVVINKGSEIVTAASVLFKKFTGIDFSLFTLENLFFITYATIFAWGMLVLMLMYLLYKLAILEPLGGKGSGLKMGMLLLCIIGYSLPIFNIFPWHMAWAGSVWIKPN